MATKQSSVPEWYFDARGKGGGRFREAATGRWTSRKQVLEWATTASDASVNVTRTWAAMISEGQLDVGAWQTLMRQEIKREYIRQYVAGRGGWGMMTPRDRSSIGGMLAEQYRYLDNFAAEIAEGKLSEGQIKEHADKSRSRMYVNSAREAYERALARTAAEAGNDEVRWVLGPVKTEHCDDCVAFDALGWQKVADDPYGGAFPGSAATQCLSNCMCNLDYRRSKNAEGA